MAITLGDISVRYVNLLLETTEALDTETEGLKAQYQLSPFLLAQPQARISIPRYMRLGYECIQRTALPTLGLEMAKKAMPSLMGLAGLTASCAPSIEQALADIARFEPLSSKNVRGHSRFFRERQHGVAEFYSLKPYNEFNLFVVDLALAVQTSLVRTLSGQSIHPTLVEIEYPTPADTSAFEAYFQCPVRFNQPRNALSFSEADLKRALTGSNRVTYQECLALCEAQLVASQKELSFLDRVREAISPLLGSDELTLAQVGLRLDMPAWTLQRRLKQENTSFKALLDDTRRDLALIYIRDPQYTLGEIAYLLGFANPNAFQRAFKRWTGFPAGQFRKTQLTG
jgi:AraC-like DNA-binding protein